MSCHGTYTRYCGCKGDSKDHVTYTNVHKHTYTHIHTRPYHKHTYIHPYTHRRALTFIHVYTHLKTYSHSHFMTSLDNPCKHYLNTSGGQIASVRGVPVDTTEQSTQRQHACVKAVIYHQQNLTWHRRGQASNAFWEIAELCNLEHTFLWASTHGTSRSLFSGTAFI